MLFQAHQQASYKYSASVVYTVLQWPKRKLILLFMTNIISTNKAASNNDTTNKLLDGNKSKQNTLHSNEKIQQLQLFLKPSYYTSYK